MRIALSIANKSASSTIFFIDEPIVTKALFYKVQTIIDGGKNQLKVAHKKVNPKYPLKDFDLCPKCHSPLLAS